jgi:signal transduction histidine kinase
VKNFEYQGYRKDGTKIWLCATLRAVVRDGVVVEYHGMNEDITERKSLEEELRQTQKMDALGHFAVNVAHEFNNLLNVITGYGELLQSHLPLGRDRDYAMEMFKAAVRAAALTSQLLVFSRRQPVHLSLLDLNAAIRKWYLMMTRLLDKKIAVTLKLSPDLWWVKVDSGQIEQILMNLAINAGDAMPHGGNLIIETTNVELDETHSSKNTSVVPGSYIMMSFGDTGCGMDADTQARMFEPFFTTKSPGKGTGLGLSTVFGIVKQNYGHIVVHSEPKLGTTFRIYFPRGDQARRSVGAGAGASNNSHRG